MPAQKQEVILLYSNMFQFFPKTLYQINDFDFQKVTDLNVSAQMTGFIKTFIGSSGIRQFIVKDGERPEALSYRLYGTTKYDYLILLFNNIESVYDEWPRNSVALNDFIFKKYGANNIQVITHWYNGDEDEVGEFYWNTLTNDPNKFTRTNYEYELYLNDEKSKIQIFDISVAMRFETGLQELFDNL